MLNTLIAASFFGGLGLVLLTAMANLLRIVSSAAWIPALVAMICCLTVGSILMSPDRQTAGPNTAAAFFSYHASQPSPKEETHVPPLPESADESPEHSAGKTLLWKPGITADADGRATISIEPSDAALSVTIDAHDAGRFGSARLIVPATKSGK
jgi:hypothetical protein